MDFTNVFGTDKTKYPFLLDAGLSDQNVKSANGFYEHYLIAISPNKDGDQWVTSLDGSQLGFDSDRKLLTYKGQQVTDHTYAIFLIQRAQRPNVLSLLFTSNTPWAVLGLSTFFQAPLPKITKKDDISGVEGQYVKNLGDCTGLLKRELRFSALDRATALYAFADRAKEMIAASCKDSNISASDCGTPQLDSSKQGMADIFQLKSPGSQLAAQSASQALRQQVQQKMQNR
jgi:hypothetical protein